MELFSTPPGTWRKHVPSLTPAFLMVALGVIIGPSAAAQTAPIPADAPPFYVTDDVAEQESARKIAGWTRALAREREATANQLDWDATYYALDLDLDHVAEMLTGVVTVAGEELAGGGINEVELDLWTAMNVSQVFSNGTPCAFTHAADLLSVTLERPYTSGETWESSGPTTRRA